MNKIIPIFLLCVLFFFLLAGCCLPPADPAFAGTWQRTYINPMNAAVSLYRYTLASSSFQYDYYLNSAFQYSYRGELSYTSTVITTVNLEETTTEGGPWTAYTGGTPIQTFTYSLNEPTLTLDTNDFIRQ